MDRMLFCNYQPDKQINIRKRSHQYHHHRILSSRAGRTNLRCVGIEIWAVNDGLPNQMFPQDQAHTDTVWPILDTIQCYQGKAISSQCSWAAGEFQGFEATVEGVCEFVQSDNGHQFLVQALGCYYFMQRLLYFYTLACPVVAGPHGTFIKM